MGLIYIYYLAPEWVQSIVLSMSVWLSVCLLAYLENHIANFTNVCTCYLWWSFSDDNDVYFRFCGWRHVCLMEQIGQRIIHVLAYVLHFRPISLQLFVAYVSAAHRRQALRPMSHLRFYRATLSHSKVAACSCACHTLRICHINSNWPISLVGACLWYKVAVCEMHTCVLQLCRAIKLRDKIARVTSVLAVAIRRCCLFGDRDLCFREISYSKTMARTAIACKQQTLATNRLADKGLLLSRLSTTDIFLGGVTGLVLWPCSYLYETICDYENSAKLQKLGLKSDMCLTTSFIITVLCLALICVMKGENKCPDQWCCFMELEGLSRAHTSPPTLTFDLPKFNHLVPCGQGCDWRSSVTVRLELAPGSCSHTHTHTQTHTHIYVPTQAKTTSLSFIYQLY